MKDVHKILQCERLTATQKLLLITIQTLPDTFSKGVSYTDMAFYTSLAKATIITNVKVLEDFGFLEVVRHDTRLIKYRVKGF